MAAWVRRRSIEWVTRLDRVGRGADREEDAKAEFLFNQIDANGDGVRSHRRRPCALKPDGLR